MRCLHLLSVVLWIKLSSFVREETLSSVLQDSSFRDVAQSGTHQTVPEIWLDEDIHDPGDAGSVHFGQWVCVLHTETEIFPHNKDLLKQRLSSVAAQEFLAPDTLPLPSSPLLSPPLF